MEACMLEYGISKIKSWAAKVPSVHDPRVKIKCYEVLNGDLAIWTGGTVMMFTGLARKRPNGLFDFETHDEFNGQAIFPWLDMCKNSYQCKFGLKIEVLTHIHNILTAWLKPWKEDEEILNPIAQLQIGRKDHFYNLCLRLVPGPEMLGKMEFTINGINAAYQSDWTEHDGDDEEPEFQDVKFTYQAHDLLAALAPFANMKCKTKTVFFRYNTDDKGHASRPVFLNISYLGQQVIAGLGFGVGLGADRLHQIEEVFQTPKKQKLNAPVVPMFGGGAVQA